MGKLPRVSGKDLLRFLEREGFAVIRVRGSHHVLTRGDIDTVVPVHGNRTLAIGTLRKMAGIGCLRHTADIRGARP